MNYLHQSLRRLSQLVLPTQRQVPAPFPTEPNVFAGETVADLRKCGGSNFHRTHFLNEQNRQVVKAAAREDYTFFLRHLLDQDGAHPDLYDDERVENRPGLQRILADVGREPRRRILEIGCGNCELLKRLQGYGHEVVGVDPSPIRVLQNRDMIRELHFGFAEHLPLQEESVDTVIGTELLEHVCNLELTLREMLRVLRLGGVVHCQVPLADFADGVNHVRHFSEATIRHVFGLTGFQINKVELLPYLHSEAPNNLYVTATKVDVLSLGSHTDANASTTCG